MQLISPSFLGILPVAPVYASSYSDGIEDTAFYANVGSGFNDVVRDVALQSDGKILV
jgi:hypothetical protein